MLSHRDWVGCKGSQIIATLMRSIAHQCASRQDPPLSSMAHCQANLGWRQNKDIIYPFYIHFQSNDSLRIFSKMGSFLVSSPQFDFLAHLRTWIDKSVECYVVWFILFALLVSFFFACFIFLLSFHLTRNPSPVSTHLHTIRNRRLLIRNFLSCGYKPLKFGGHTELVHVATNPGGGNVDHIHKGGWRVYIPCCWSFCSFLCTRLVLTIRKNCFVLANRVMLLIWTNWRLWHPHRGGRRSRWLLHLRKSAIK